MSRKLYLLLVMVMASGLIALGCGDDDDDGGGSDEPAKEESGGGTGGGGDVPANVEEAVEQCEQQINSVPNLSDDAKKDLENVCQDAAEGDEEAVREASKKVCETIIKDTVPDGPAREQALSSCEQVGATP
jgi:hypothetical protein